MAAVRNPIRTKAKILQQSTRLFARSGYDGTSTNDIVSATQVNKRMIYHYFENKRGLYRAVFRNQWAGLKEWLDGAPGHRLQSPTDLRVVLRESLELLFDYFARNQIFVRLLLWEGLEGGAIARSIWKEVRGPLFVQWESLVKRAQREGLLDRRIDPAQLIVTFLGAIIYYFAYASSISDMLGKAALTPAAMDARKKHLVLLLDRLLRP